MIYHRSACAPSAHDAGEPWKRAHNVTAVMRAGIAVHVSNVKHAS